MMLWLRPKYILALITSLCCSSSFVSSKTYEKFWCATEEGHHQISCTDDRALLTEISIRKVYRRSQMCQPDDHSDYLIHCQSFVDASLCEGNRTCSIEISSRDYLQCGEKSYSPTYFFVKYTCTQLHTMCVDVGPIRNTLYGYIVSPAYPHPMADNLTCSINIEAEPSMFIEVSPIEISLQDALKCRSEYLELFGYDSSFDETNADKNSNTMWKSLYTWCGKDQSMNHPISRARYIISSNLLYLSLKSGVSKTSRSFKIRYKILPSTVRNQYNSDGIAFSSTDHREMFGTVSINVPSTSTISTTLFVSGWNSSDLKSFDGTSSKRPNRKILLIGIIVGVVVLLLLAVLTVAIILIFIKRRRRSSSNKKTTQGKKSPSTSTATNNPTSKPAAGKSSDKAPLLEQTNNTEAASTKRKLVPERTVQISDVTSSRFKANESLAKINETTSSKLTLTAADSGIYGADLTEENTIKTTVLTVTPIPPPPPPPVAPEPKPVPSVPEPVDQEDKTIQSAYPALIDATTSENEAPSNDVQFDPRKISINGNDSIPIAFNPLHVILKKDANKYYTSEYI